MAVFNFKKDKNFIYITRADDTSTRNYTYDINSDTFFNVKTGNTITTIPGLKTAIMNSRRDMIYYLLYFKVTYNCTDNFKEKIKLLDTIYNINPKAGDCPDLMAQNGLRALQAAVKAYSKEIDRPDFRTFFKNREREFRTKELCKILLVDNLSNVDLDFFENLKMWLEDKYNNERNLRLIYSWWKEEGEWGSTCNGFPHLIATFFNKAEVLQYSPQKLHFYEQYTKVSKAYELIKEKHDKAVLLEWYNQFNLAFSNDLFEVIIPQNKQDFVDEAAQQHNCVFRSYYPLVIDKSTLIVFIRYRADKNKSYITCEVSPSTGKIRQYLKQYNERVTEENACLFREAYQEFLLKQFNSLSF